MQNLPPTPKPTDSYSLVVRANDQGKFIVLEETLGWGKPMLTRLDGLRKVLDGDAAKEMDVLLGKLSEQRKAATKTDADPKAGTADPPTASSAEPSKGKSDAKEKAENQQREVYFSGHVQGVGFRQTTSTLAKQFSVIGFVKNLPDGRVQLVVEGQPKEVGAFLAAVRKEMEKNIAKTEETTKPATGEFQGFGIRQ